MSLHDRIYVIGGYDGRSRLSSVECLDYTSDEDGIWYSVAPMNVRRGLAGATTLGGTSCSPDHAAWSVLVLECPEPVCAEWDGSGGGGEPEVLASQRLDVETEYLPTYPERSSASAASSPRVCALKERNFLRDYGVGSTQGGDSVTYYWAQDTKYSKNRPALEIGTGDCAEKDP